MKAEHGQAGTRCAEIKVGRSGAAVYEVDGNLILKHVERRKLEGALFDTYAREALFYRAMAERRRSWLPEVIDVKITDDEIILLMKKYRTPDRGDLNEAMIRRIAETLARIHTESAPEFLRSGVKPSDLLTEQQAEACGAEWEDVLNEHPGSFDAAPLKRIAEKINGLIAWNDAEERVLIHGDFHWENLLADEQGGLRVCDWQSVGLGGASGDLSFFMSRLGSDGIRLDPMHFLTCYGDAVREISGQDADIPSIAGHIAAANAITSFVFWHRFLHGAETERVRGIYQKMTEDFLRTEGCLL